MLYCVFSFCCNIFLREQKIHFFYTSDISGGLIIDWLY